MCKIYNFIFPKLEKIELVSVWKKGKNNKGFRFLMEDIKTKKQFLLWVEPTDFPVPNKFKIEWSENLNSDNFKNFNHIKLRCYNYYLINNDAEILLDSEIKKWLDSDPMVPENVNSFTHTFFSSVNYQPVIKI